MAIPTLAHKWAKRLLKTAVFLLIDMIVGSMLGDPEIYINHGLASQVCNFLYGDVNAETIYDTY